VGVFRCESLLEIIAFAERALAERGAVAFRVLDPDLGKGRYAGEIVEHGGERFVHRPFRVWVDLAERIGARLLTPRVDGAFVEIRLEALDASARWQAPSGDETERYGAASGYGRISKLEDPGFVIDMREALERAQLPVGARILHLGVNAGDEIALVRQLQPGLGARFVGIDHSASALAVARERFAGDADSVSLVEADLNTLAPLGLGRFDLVISIGTLQSPGVDDREVVRRVVQEHLAATGAVIFAFPNCRYIDGETSHGARMKNFRQPELGLVVKDVAFYRKYLQQHHRQVFVTGKSYVLVTGVAETGPGPRVAT
jgi:SAM-dependent methyltransferase